MDDKKRRQLLRRITSAYSQPGATVDEVIDALGEIVDEVKKARKAKTARDRKETGGHDRSEGSEE